MQYNAEKITQRNCFQKLERYQLNALSFSEYFIPMAGLRVTLIPQRTGGLCIRPNIELPGAP